MNLGEQYLTKDMKKLLEDAQKLMNSESMQMRIKQEKAILSEKERSGLIAQYELMKKQIEAVAPQFFPKPLEDIAHTKEKYSVRYKTPEPDLEEQIRNTKEKLQQLQRKAFAKDVCDFYFLWEVADEYNYRWIEGAYDTEKLAFQDAVHNTTVKGQSIELATMEESIQRLHQELSKKKKRKPQDLKTYKPSSEK